MTQTVTFQVTGLHCASCVARAEKALAAVPGVTEARVNLATEMATAETAGVDTQTLTDALSAIGFGAVLQSTDKAPDKEEEIATLKRDLLLAAVLTLPVFIVEMGGHLYPPLHHWIMATVGHQTSWWAQFGLTTAVMFGPGLRFFRTGLPALARLAPEMNSLVAIGTLAAWGYSTAVLFASDLFPPDARSVYFEAAAVIVTLILLGRFLEARAKGRAGDAIRQLVALRPQMADVRRSEGFEEIPIAALRVGDVVRLRPGSRVPADGFVVAGQSHLDEAMLTGEPEPKAKTPGDPVTGGTVNGSGVLEVEVSATGAATTLSQIIAMVEAAQGAKLPMQRLIDRVTAVFVPVVLAAAALTALVWWLLNPGLALITGVSVLIIACPCAMGLATPISIVVGIGRAAGLGVFFRRGEALQALSSVKVVAFDKTGTLTVGRPVVTEAAYAPGWTPEAALPLIAAAEAASEHPLARAILQFASDADASTVVADSFQAASGRGVEASVADQEILVGSERFLRERGFEVEWALPQLSNTDGTQVFAAVNGQPVAAFAIADALRESASSLVQGLRAQGLEVAMITGDAAPAAQTVAEGLGISQVHAGVLPSGKQDAVADLQRRLGPVAFVGDGINDAPALAAADVGVAMGGGTDVAVESADIVLMGSDLHGVAQALTVARATMRNIKQNLFWAFAYNAALIPLAAGIAYPLLLSPMLAAGAMAASSVCVVANALRLRRVGGRT